MLAPLRSSLLFPIALTLLAHLSLTLFSALIHFDISHRVMYIEPPHRMLLLLNTNSIKTLCIFVLCILFCAVNNKCICACAAFLFYIFTFFLFLLTSSINTLCILKRCCGIGTLWRYGLCTESTPHHTRSLTHSYRAKEKHLRR